MKVLLVTYSFPPAGGVGVLRAASLARYFPAEGIQLDVLTARNASAVGLDSELLKDIPNEVKIHRTLTLDLPFGIKKWIKNRIAGKNTSAGSQWSGMERGKPTFLKRLLQDLLLPDPQVTWLPILTRNARRIVSERNIEIVLITVPPFSSLLLVEQLRKSFPDLQIVVDFRDEWLSTTIDLVSFSRSKRAIKVAHKTEASAVVNATLVVTVTEPARQILRYRYPQEDRDKFRIIPNGFDATRLHRACSLRNARSDGHVLVTFVGTLYGSSEPKALVEAVRTLPIDIKNMLRLRFIGRIENPLFLDYLSQLGKIVELRPFLPQAEALAALSESDYALLITHDPVNVAAKFYDYIGSGKPILAAIHPAGAVRHLLEEFRAGWWASSQDVEGMRKLFIDAVARRDLLDREFKPNVQRIAQYERKILAQKYADLLRSLVGRSRNHNEYLRTSRADTASVGE